MPGAGPECPKVKNLLTGNRHSFYLTQAIEAERQKPGVITGKLWPTPDVRGFCNEGSLMMLKAVVKDRDEWSKMAYRKGRGPKEIIWPTPTCHDGTQVDPESHRNGKRNQPCLGTIINQKEGTRGGQLNPDWVCWLMGWPCGWTALGPLNPQAFREWLQAFKTGWQD